MLILNTPSSILGPRYSQLTYMCLFQAQVNKIWSNECIVYTGSSQPPNTNSPVFNYTLRTIWFHSFVGYKTESNKWTNKNKKQKLTGTSNREKGLEGSQEGQIYGDEKRFDFGWWPHTAICTWCIIELYTWNLYNFINQCHPNKFNNKFLKKL